MGFLPGIFGRPQPQQPQPQGQGQQQSFGQQGQGQQPQNGNGSAGPAQGQTGAPANSNFPSSGEAPNPLDQWMGKLTPSKEALTAQEQLQKAQNQSIFGELTPDQIQQHVAKTNFTSGIDPTKMQAALSGDVNAFSEVINQAAQAAFASSLQMTHGMVEHGVKTGNERLSSTLDSRMKDFSIKGQTAKNPALEHPLAKTFLSGIKKQIASAQPNLSPQQVQEQAEAMFGDLANHIQQPAKQAQEAQQPQGMDWGMFLDEQT